MEPSPDETVTGAAYGGSRLTGDLEAPGEYAFDGRGELATQPGAAPEQAPEDAEILGAIEEQGDWMTEVLARLVRAETTLGNEEAGQAIMRSILREDLQLEPVDVPMDAEALRAHPHAAPFDWSLEGRSNVVATWEPGRPDEISGRSLILNGHIDVVSPEPLGQWGAHDPFGADRDGEWMIGRGAADMKCGLAAIVGAVRGLRSLGLTPRAPVTIESVRGGRVQRQRDAADPARRLHGRGGRHRRAVRRRDHHLTGGGALVQRADHRRAGTCRGGP